MDPTNEILMEVRDRLVRVETKIDNMDTAKDTAIKALESASSAHKRIDKVDKIIFWSATTIIGAVILGLIALLINGGVV